MLVVRKIEESDKARWLELFRGYMEFYQAVISPNQYELAWERLLDPSYESHGFVAELDGEVVGLTHYSFQTSTWAPINYCYLEDLFTDPKARGKGVGRALIDKVKTVAEAAGSSRLYWNTDSTNSTARFLYDSYVQVSGKVQYRIKLD